MNNKLQIRPQTLQQFVGKPKIIKAIKTGLEAAKKLNKNFDHCLFYGPPGVGKTTLAHIIANEMQSRIKVIQATSIKGTSDLVSILNGIKDHDVLFIDEIHSMNRTVVEMLYSVIEDNVIDVVLGKIYNSKVIRLNLPKFTLIGATTYLGMVPKPLEDRFNYLFFIDSYTDQELKQILSQNLKIYNFQLKEKELNLIVKNSRGIPRNANRILRQIYNHQVLGQITSIEEIIQEAGFIYNGLTEIDLKYLVYLYECPGRAASLKSVTQAINLDERTIIDKIEPFLIKSKMIVKNSQGRRLTGHACEMIEQQSLIQKLKNHAINFQR